ncbi:MULTISPECIES: beta-ribofuranosylaminobenzene 5'-phosphate synthase [unclassified Methanoculleus]|uniref:beta-ribofuranosylaminobenzene 5'-phosphate synthase n=1 Tax=unclassified Methanoculleus TaxID=2619537 RepID=UPI0025DC7E08|nr:MULTISPECIES: beta-ribofuranosylaminobenzene 5'-phosphate synthase [unclassified Methanoculleus]MCK9297333.1 beta-ribofuranosylaminobenzene 5'-phosphate synthase [Methanoculleus sp.]MDD2254050.1 beta-ribofuranosylaminobenzene 5'-phosphate synthase [Methanoculleus sp.]MDD2786608.1 beta-ribofuranosylaminobenzene 5'-phosphate synthase [Methanoculleus sp.]MDD3216445.1 beta-ribofuranosylaminobenzene 5'-phosphate synthase [Methanoculleus sp.]MDD4313359.1 beta-ribofuranosylaminobenzene 5'-phosphat
MKPLTADRIGERIREIEQRIGRLSPMQKVLIGTDGSVTNLLEMATGHSVTITTRLQEVIGADPKIAAALNIEPGDEVNYRVVELKDSVTGETLIYAVSCTPLRRLAPEFRQDLMRADIPIGRILSRHRIESRREITDARVVPAGTDLARTFNVHRCESMLSRKYRIIHREEPLIAIEEIFPCTAFADEIRVLVDAPSRIHITLLDMNGASGRVDGGVGVTLDEPGCVLDARKSTDIDVRGGDETARHRVAGAARAVREGLALPGGAEFTLHASARQHAGLGSGTQVALAAAAALCRLYDRNVPAFDLARIVGRGGTSGIGTAAFEQGGFILDGGHRFGSIGGKQEFRPSAASRGIAPPPVLARHRFPEDWRILLVTPEVGAGAHGGREVDIFRTHCPVPLEEVRELCHEVLMRMIPGLVEHDLDLFGSAVNRTQALGFKKVEVAMQHPVVSSLLEAMVQAGAAGAGLSSFGPTVYAVGDTDMQDAAGAATEVLGDGGGSVILTKARNCGANVRAG